jgi:hypothetical protein
MNFLMSLKAKSFVLCTYSYSLAVFFLHHLQSCFSNLVYYSNVCYVFNTEIMLIKYEVQHMIGKI